ncbi:hypothetical protein DUNSADRAFT_17100, partial [Dunaliella salina]
IWRWIWHLLQLSSVRYQGPVHRAIWWLECGKEGQRQEPSICGFPAPKARRHCQSGGSSHPFCLFLCALVSGC